MYDQTGRPIVIEINPRPSGSYAMTMEAGVPLLDDLISLAKGEPIPDIDMPIGQLIVPFRSLASVEG